MRNPTMSISLVVRVLYAIGLCAFHQQALAEIRVGVVGPLTGDFANYGSEIERGATLAVQDLNTQGGEPVRLIAEDACLPAQAVVAAKKLLHVDKINALVGSYCVIGMVPMAPQFEAARVVAFHSSAVADEILDAGQYIFTTNVTIDDEARAAAVYAYKTLGARRAAVIFVTSQWGQNYNDSFAKHFKALGGEIVRSDEGVLGMNDFRAELTKAAAAKPDVLFLVHVGPVIGGMLKQARALGITQPIMAPHEAAEAVVIETAGEAAEGLVMFTPRLPADGAEVQRFRARFRAENGYPPGVLAANAYDATVLVVTTIRACAGDSECVKQRLYKVHDYPGVSGTFSITARGGTVKPFVRVVVRSGAFVEYPEDYSSPH